jgi:hypothetical protein
MHDRIRRAREADESRAGNPFLLPLNHRKAQHGPARTVFQRHMVKVEIGGARAGFFASQPYELNAGSEVGPATTT